MMKSAPVVGDGRVGRAPDALGDPQSVFGQAGIKTARGVPAVKARVFTVSPFRKCARAARSAVVRA